MSHAPIKPNTLWCLSALVGLLAVAAPLPAAVAETTDDPRYALVIGQGDGAALAQTVYSFLTDPEKGAMAPEHIWYLSTDVPAGISGHPLTASNLEWTLQDLQGLADARVLITYVAAPAVTSTFALEGGDIPVSDLQVALSEASAHWKVTLWEAPVINADTVEANSPLTYPVPVMGFGYGHGGTITAFPTWPGAENAEAFKLGNLTSGLRAAIKPFMSGASNDLTLRQWIDGTNDAIVAANGAEAYPFWVTNLYGIVDEPLSHWSRDHAPGEHHAVAASNEIEATADQAALYGGSSVALTYHVAQLLFGQWPIGDGAEGEPEVIVEVEPEPQAEVIVAQPEVVVTPPVQVTIETRQLTRCEELRIATYDARQDGYDIKADNRRAAYEAMRAGNTDACYLGLGTTCTEERVAVLQTRLDRVNDWVECLDYLDTYRGTGCCDLEGKHLHFGQWMREGRGHHGMMMKMHSGGDRGMYMSGQKKSKDDGYDAHGMHSFNIKPEFGGGVPPGVASSGTVVIDKVVMHWTPQSGTWRYCFDAFTGAGDARFHVSDDEDGEYGGDEITIHMGLEVPLSGSNRVDFKMQLDDDEDSVCNEKAEDKFSAYSAELADYFYAGAPGNSGSQRFAAYIHTRWAFTLYWHVK